MAIRRQESRVFGSLIKIYHDCIDILFRSMVREWFSKYISNNSYILSTLHYGYYL